jgi:hypothetical protein
MSFNLINNQIALMVSEVPIEEDQDEEDQNEKVSVNEHPIFSRIDSNTQIICNFCKKFAIRLFLPIIKIFIFIFVIIT